MPVKIIVAAAAGILAAGGLLYFVNGQLKQAPDTATSVFNTPLKVRNLSMNAFNACGITLDQQDMVCWGPPGLPRGNTDETPGPKNIGLRNQFANLYGGGLAFCGVTSDHQAQCWGSSAFGQTGTLMSESTHQGTLTPYPLAEFEGSITSMAAGLMHFCALSSDSNVWCWGVNNKGILATDDEAVVVETPSRVSFFDGDATKLYAGFLSTCASTDEGKLYCWGLHGSDNPSRLSTSPEEIDLPGPAEAVALGQARSCAVVDGELYCWGIHPNLSRSGWVMDATPVKQEFAGTGITSVASNGHKFCFIQDGDVKCWGYPVGSSILENISDYSETLDVIPDINGRATAVAIGEYMSCALLIDDSVSCWGTFPDPSVTLNLGNFSTSGNHTPVTVLAPVRILR